MELSSLIRFIVHEELPFINAYHWHTSHLVFIELRYVHHYLVEHGLLTNKAKLCDWARRYFGIAIRCGIGADAMCLAYKQTGAPRTVTR